MMMAPEITTLFAPLFMFGMAAAFTPGPNNIMLTASGANFGFLRTLPHMSGICGGFALLMVVIASGLGVVFESHPQMQTVLKILGSLYLFFFAWKIATAGRTGRVSRRAAPFTFVQAAGFQFVNPKGWLMAMSAMSAFTLTGDLYQESVAAVMAVFLTVTAASVVAWAGFGTAIGRFLKSDKSLSMFNFAMAGLTAASVVLLFV